MLQATATVLASPSCQPCLQEDHAAFDSFEDEGAPQQQALRKSPLRESTGVVEPSPSSARPRAARASRRASSRSATHFAGTAYASSPGSSAASTPRSSADSTRQELRLAAQAAADVVLRGRNRGYRLGTASPTAATAVSELSAVPLGSSPGSSPISSPNVHRRASSYTQAPDASASSPLSPRRSTGVFHLPPLGQPSPLSSPETPRVRRSCPADVLRRQAGDSDANYDEAIAAVLADNEYSVEAQTKAQLSRYKAQVTAQKRELARLRSMMAELAKLPGAETILSNEKFASTEIRARHGSSDRT